MLKWRGLRGLVPRRRNLRDLPRRPRRELRGHLLAVGLRERGDAVDVPAHGVGLGLHLAAQLLRGLVQRRRELRFCAGPDLVPYPVTI